MRSSLITSIGLVLSLATGCSLPDDDTDTNLDDDDSADGGEAPVECDFAPDRVGLIDVVEQHTPSGGSPDTLRWLAHIRADLW